MEMIVKSSDAAGCELPAVSWIWGEGHQIYKKRRRTMNRRILTKLSATVLLVAFLLSMGVGWVVAQEQAKININKASVEELSTLKRVGPSYAQRIVDYRKEHGPFEKPEDIMKVRGIGIQVFEANKDIITCE
jgi:competence protein ComEA